MRGANKIQQRMLLPLRFLWRYLRPRGHGDAAERFSGRQPPVPSVSARCEAASRWHY